MKCERRGQRKTSMPFGSVFSILALALGMSACGADSVNRSGDTPDDPLSTPNNMTGMQPPAPPRPNPVPPASGEPVAPTPAPTPAPMPPPASQPMPVPPTPEPPMSMDPPPSGPAKSPVEGDDTFADLNRPGPVITIAGHQGHKGYKLMKWEEGTKIDARTAVWDSYMACPSRATCTSVAKNSYPIQMGADWVDTFPLRVDLYNDGKCPEPVKEKVYWIGGVINGTAPLEIGWSISKHNNGGGMSMNAIGNVVDGVRMHNLHDPFLPLRGNDFTIKNSWVTYARDDTIENDAFAAGLVEDNFFEGFFYVYSCTNTNGRAPVAYAPGGGPNSVVKFHKNLIAFKAGMNGVEGNPWGRGMWKVRDGRAPQIEFVDNIVYIPPNGRTDECGVRPGRSTKVEGNVLVDIPGCGGSPAGFKVMTGAAGQAFWDKAVTDWIARHPLVGRVKGDPGYGEFMARIGEPATP